MNKAGTVLVTGARGLVGSAISKKLSSTFEVLRPSHKLLDITTPSNVASYMRQYRPSVVVHAAAFTDTIAAELERGDKKGRAWETNVRGTQNIDNEAKRVGAFHIFISTGSVFAGTRHIRGPFTEKTEPSSRGLKLTWYGWTKRMAERHVDGAIVRISHPDYLNKLISLWRLNSHHAFYSDQRFPLTSFDDLARAIDKLIEKQVKGIYHVASPDLVSPYELISYYCRRLGLPTNEIVAQSSPLKTRYHAISSVHTQNSLGLKFASWRQIVDRELTSSSRG